MKIRNKTTGQIFEVLPGTLYAKNIFEEVKDEEIKVGEPTIEFEIEEVKEEPKVGIVSEITGENGHIGMVNPKKKTRKKTTRKTKKGAKKNDNTKRD